MSARTETAVHDALLENADKAGTVILTDTEIAALTGLSRRTVCYALRELRLREVILSDLFGDMGTKRVIHLRITD